ncbi:hypothetical protein TIFTF001_051858, partial [Ficus carica]
MIIIWVSDQRNHRGRPEIRHVARILLAIPRLGRRFVIVDGDSTTSTTMASSRLWSSGEVAIARRIMISICMTPQFSGRPGFATPWRPTQVVSKESTPAPTARVSDLGELDASDLSVCERLWGFVCE